MGGLKPCPFCGGEAHVKEVVSACDRLYTVGCSDSECMGYETWLLKSTVDEAISAWNRRAERTCRMVEEVRGVAHCSECGYEYDWHDCSGIPEKGEPYEYDVCYCKNCGARVVSE